MCKSENCVRVFVAMTLLASVCGLAGQATQAATITWGTPTAIATADATLTQTGTVLEAAYMGSAPVNVTLSNGEIITFQAASLNGSSSSAPVNVTGDTSAEVGAFSGNTGNANFDTVLNCFDGGVTRRDITIKNLVAGRDYSVQLFALDNRNSTTQAWTASYADTADYSGNNSAAFTMGESKYVIGAFTATASSEMVYERCHTYFSAVGATYAQFNAVVVRDITVPEPGTIVLFCAGIIGLLAYAWRKRK